MTRGSDPRALMMLLANRPLELLTPSRLWAEVDTDTRQLAARCLYDPDWDDAGARIEADAAIAAALRFRPTAVRRLPVDKRVHYLTRAVHPDDSLAGALLRALHISCRREILAAFLDALGIPQQDGVIDTEGELEPPETGELLAAAGELRERYPSAHVDLYLAALFTMDPDFWAGLTDVVRPGA
jgi:hypothetical protein